MTASGVEHVFAEADGSYTAGCTWQWYRVLSGCVCIITWVRQNMFWEITQTKSRFL